MRDFKFSTSGATRKGGRPDLFGRIFDKLLNDIAIDLGVEPDISVSDSPWPPVSITTNKDGATVELELAGYRKEDLSIGVEGQIITISGERDNTGFTKTFRLDTNVFDVDSLNATYENGLLTVTLGKLEKTEKRTVTIQ